MGEYCSEEILNEKTDEYEQCTGECDLGECYCDKHLREYITLAKKEEAENGGEETELSRLMKFPNGKFERE